MTNRGVYPLDPTTNVGKFRLGRGDVTSVPLSPVESGYQDYAKYSDDEITQYLEMGLDSVNRAIGYSYLQASGAASEQSKTVKDYDLAVDLTKRAEDLRKTAAYYFELADQQDALTGDSDAFVIVDTGDDSTLRTRIEAFPYWPGAVG